MERVVRAISVVALLAAAAATARAVEYAFVLQEGEEASVYDTSTLALAANVEVGAGALQAIGVPSLANPAVLEKIYVVAESSVVTLGGQPPFPVLGREPLTLTVNMGRRSAQLTPNGRWLLVAAGDFLFAFDAQAPGATAPILIPMGGAPTGVAVIPDGSRAFVTVEGSLILSVVNLDTTPPQRLAGPVELPAIPLTAAAAPNAAGVYTMGVGRAVAVDSDRNTVVGEIDLGPGAPFAGGFDREAPLDEMFVASGASISTVNIDRFSLDFVAGPPVTIKHMVSPGSDLYYLVSESSRQAFRTNRTGSAMDLLRDPRSNTPFTAPAVDVAVNRAHSAVFVLFDEGGGLVRLSAAGDEVEAEAGVSGRPRLVDLVGAPALEATSLSIYGGDNQAGAGGTPLPRRIAVLATDEEGLGVAGVEVAFNSFSSGAAIVPNRVTTNLYGVASARVSPQSTTGFTVEGRTAAGLTAQFELNTEQAGQAGLEVLSGDYQVALPGTDFPRMTTIRTATFGVPDQENTLTITPRDDGVSCPPSIDTGQDGSVTFQCAAGVQMSAFPRITLVDVVDEFGRILPEPLTFTVAPDDMVLPAEPLVDTLEEIVVPAGGRTEDAIRMRLIRKNGLDSSRNVGVEFEVDGPPLSFDPRIAPSSNLDGRLSAAAVGGCRLGRGTITSSVNSHDLWENEFAYRIVTGPAAAIARAQGNGQSGDAGQRLDGPGQALVVRISDPCGNPVGNEPVSFTVSPAGAVMLDNVSPRTNGNGEASAIAVLGTRPGLAAVTVTTPGGLATTFDLRVNVTPTQVVKISGDGQRVAVGESTAQRLVVAVQNDLGAGAGAIPVTFAIVEGAGNLASPAQAVTDEQGRASVSVIGGQLGRLVVEARALDFSTRFVLEVIGRTPIVSTLGFVNAASFVTGLVPCSAGSIFGVGLMEGVEGVVLAQGAPFPTRLRGVRVTVDGVEAPILALINVNGQEQINIQTPCFTKAPSNEVVVAVDNNGVSATFTGIRTLAVQPGVYARTTQQGLLAAAVHLDGSLVEPSNPARPNEVVQLFWNGGGAITPLLATNSPGPASPLSFVDVGVAVRLGGELTEVLASVYAPGFITLYQTNIRVGANAQTGLLPLTIEQGGETSIEVLLPVAQ